MHALSTLLALCLVLLTSVANAAILPRQSTVPCSYSCPARDNENNNFQGEGQSTATTLVCRYRENGDGRNCSYSKSTGNLTDGNTSRCPARAVGNSGCSKKRDAFPVRKIRSGDQPSKGKKVVMNRFKKRKN